jgi:hypothetical protein
MKENPHGGFDVFWGRGIRVFDGHCGIVRRNLENGNNSLATDELNIVGSGCLRRQGLHD